MTKSDRRRRVYRSVAEGVPVREVVGIDFENCVHIISQITNIGQLQRARDAVNSRLGELQPQGTSGGETIRPQRPQRPQCPQFGSYEVKAINRSLSAPLACNICGTTFANPFPPQ